MGLGLPGEVIEIVPGQLELAQANVAGVRWLVSIALLADDPPRPGDQLLIHVDTALSKLSTDQDASLSGTRARADLAGLYRAAAPAQVHRSHELIGQVVGRLFGVGLSLEAAIDLSRDEAVHRVTAALQCLDDTIREIRNHVILGHDHDGPSALAPPRETE